MQPERVHAPPSARDRLIARAHRAGGCDQRRGRGDAGHHGEQYAGSAASCKPVSNVVIPLEQGHAGLPVRQAAPTVDHDDKSRTQQGTMGVPALVSVRAKIAYQPVGECATAVKPLVGGQVK
ncbi:hypothetical protein GCM10027184_72720 [Saccharothrix stipae]